MDNRRRFPPQRLRKKPKEEGCTIETRTTKSGKKIMIGKGCTREQIEMMKESGELSLNKPSRGGNGEA